MSFSRGYGYNGSGVKYSYTDMKPVVEENDPHSFAAMQNYGTYGTANPYEVALIRKQREAEAATAEANKRSLYQKQLERDLAQPTVEQQLLDTSSGLYERVPDFPRQPLGNISLGLDGAAPEEHSVMPYRDQLKPEVRNTLGMTRLGRSGTAITQDEFSERERAKADQRLRILEAEAEARRQLEREKEAGRERQFGRQMYGKAGERQMDFADNPATVAEDVITSASRFSPLGLGSMSGSPAVSAEEGSVPIEQMTREELMAFKPTTPEERRRARERWEQVR